MLLSLAFIIILGLISKQLFKLIKIPSLIAFILIGIILGPHTLNFIDISLLNISNDIRQIILIVILTRAGLSLNLDDLKQVGLPAFLLSFIPASLEIIGIMFIAPILLNISLLDAALLGSVLAAVSPAVVAPRMIYLIQTKYGDNKKIPQLILAGASIDDIYALVLFTSFLAIASGSNYSTSSLLNIPFSILIGILTGIFSGFIISKILNIIKLETTYQILFLLAASFILVSLENYFTISGILAVMSMAMIINKFLTEDSNLIADAYNKMWKLGEILLFVLVGASVNINFAFKQGITPIIIIIFALGFRIIGVWFSLLKTNLNMKEKIFVAISYIPKATVQAVIGSIPFNLGLSSGELILSVSVIAILFTAPLGAIGIDSAYKKLLLKQ